MALMDIFQDKTEMEAIPPEQRMSIILDQLIYFPSPNVLSKSALYRIAMYVKNKVPFPCKRKTVYGTNQPETEDQI